MIGLRRVRETVESTALKVTEAAADTRAAVLAVACVAGLALLIAGLALLMARKAVTA